MLYLSQLTLSPRSRQVQAEMRDPYEMHRTLAKAFGEGEEAQVAARCLFRVEEDRQGILRLLVQSQQPPAWEYLTALPGYLLAAPQVKPFAPSLRKGQALAFRLRANPTVRRDGKRLGLYGEEERLAWLRRKGAENGFSVERVTISSEHSSKCQAKSHKAVFSAVLFEGILRINDPELLLVALTNGIGAGKGFGFGLLSLAPVK